MPLFQETKNDWYIVALVLVLSLGANLPDFLAQRFYINQQLLVLGLAAIVAYSLVRYLKFALLLVVVILAVGANLPEQIAQEIGLDKKFLMLGLMLMIAVSLANRFLKLDTGLKKVSGNSSLHGVAALFKAISFGRVTAVKNLLKGGVNINAKTISGITPLILASSKGYADVVLILLENGANPDVKGKDDKTAKEFAEALGYSRVVDVLENFRMPARETAPA